MVADVRGWKESPTKYDEVLERLTQGLRLPGVEPEGYLN